jgi:hypothetical protein
LSHNGGSLSVTFPTMDKFVSYLTDNGGSLSAVYPTTEEVCQLLVRQCSIGGEVTDKLPPLLVK